MIPYIWFVSEKALPIEKAVIAGMAAAFRARGGNLVAYIDGATGGVESDETYSWKSLTWAERFVTVLCPTGALWHLWGPAPMWWPLVRVRARTAHTALPSGRSQAGASYAARDTGASLPGGTGKKEKISWRGYPSRLFPCDAHDGEAGIVPTFDARISDNALSGPHVALPGALGALRAAALTMRGLVTAAEPSAYLDAMLGADGYLRVTDDTEDGWMAAMKAAESDEGRKTAAAARYYIKSHCSVDACADSLIALYRKIGGKRA